MVISVSGHPGQGPDVAFAVDRGSDGTYRLWIEDRCPWAPGRISVTLTDAQRRELIHTLGGIPVKPAIIHAGYREAPADAPAEVS